MSHLLDCGTTLLVYRYIALPQNCQIAHELLFVLSKYRFLIRLTWKKIVP